MKDTVKNVLLTMGVVLSLSSVNVFAQDVTVYLDGAPIEFCDDLNKDGVTLFPLRDICETSGCDILWDEYGTQVKIRNGSGKSLFTIGTNEIVTNGEKSNLDVAPEIINGRTYVSEEALKKCFDFDTLWDEEKKILYMERDNENDTGHQLEHLHYTFEKRDYGDALFTVDVMQILNGDNDEAIEKINKHCWDMKQNKGYLDLQSDYENFTKNTHTSKELLDEGSLVQKTTLKDYDEYELSYEVGYNANNILSLISYKFTPETADIKGDVYNTRTGERLKIEDILKDGSVDGIEKALLIGYQEKIKQMPELYNESYEQGLAEKARNIKEEDELAEAGFYIEGKDLVFTFYSSWLHNIRINIDEHKDLFEAGFLDDFYGLVKSLERTSKNGEVYYMPYINLNTQDAIKINNCIEDLYKSLNDMDVKWSCEREGDVLHINISYLGENEDYEFQL